MEINPYESRLRMLQQIDGVQMQREAAPDEETAGCPGCPYFWTCPIPHRGEEVKAPVEIERADVQDDLGPRAAYRPRDEADVGWTDEWVDENGLRLDQAELAELTAQEPEPELAEELEQAPELTELTSPKSEPAPAPSTADRGRRRSPRRGLFRRRS